MIRSLTIRNFRCLREVDLELEPLTVLVGANASGKSSVFRAISRHPWDWTDHSSQAANNTIQVRVKDPRGNTSERLQEQGQTKSNGSAWPQIQLFQFNLQQLRAPVQVTEQRSIGSDGESLTNVFATLTRKQQDSIAKTFCHLVPLFQDIGARPLGQGQHRLVFQDRWNDALWYEPGQVSDGTMLMLAFLLLPYQSPAPDVIAIEEPERGLHPFLMGELIQALRKLTRGELGPKPVQVLLATHSADLLEFVEPHEVRFFNRSRETGETKVQLAPTKDPAWSKLLREYDNSLGDLWLSGGLGGVPGA